MKKRLIDFILSFAGSGGTYPQPLEGVLTDVTIFPPNHQDGWCVRLTRDVKGSKSAAVIEAKDETKAKQWQAELTRCCGAAMSKILDCKIEA